MWPSQKCQFGYLEATKGSDVQQVSEGHCEGQTSRRGQLKAACVMYMPFRTYNPVALSE